MINRINTFNNFYNHKLVQPVNTTSNTCTLSSNKSDLSGLLFGKKPNSGYNLSFGWSKGLPEVEEKILDVLTATKNKNVLVVSHIVPDPDAYASIVGVCGILERTGVKTYPVIDGTPMRGYKYMPSIEPDKTAAEFIKTPSDIKKIWKENNIDSVDVAVLTDCTEPSRISKDGFKLISKAKKIILIDHHGKNDNDLANKEKWISLLKEANSKLKDSDILYWRDSKRQSASEMVAELDKEILDEFQTAKDKKSGWFLKYDSGFYGAYRTALAAGIYADSGGMIQQNSLKYKSEKQIKTRQGNMNSNEFYLNWLTKNSGTSISLNDITKSHIPPYIFTTAKEVVSGKRKIDGIDVVLPSRLSPFAYAHIRDCASLEQFINPFDKNKDDIAHEDILQAIKANSKPEQQLNKCKLFVLAKSKKNFFTLSLRSKESLAEKVVESLTLNGFGNGGGHGDSSGFRSVDGKTFEEALPFINQVVDEHTKDYRTSMETRSNEKLWLNEALMKENKIISDTINAVISGVKTVEGLEIKLPTVDSSTGYIYIKDLSALDNILNTSEVRDREALRQDILKSLENVLESGLSFKHCQCFVFARKDNQNNTLTMDIRSLSDLNSKIKMTLDEEGFGVREGSQFNFFEGKDFENALPVIQQAVNTFFEQRILKQQTIAKEDAIIDTTIRNLIEGVQQIDGIETSQITDKNPIGYVYIRDLSVINKILNQPSIRNEVTLQADILKRLENIAMEYSSDPTKLLITVKRIPQVPRFVIKFNTGNPLSEKLTKKLLQKGIGDYELKNDRFKSKQGRSFEEALHLIQELVKENRLTIKPEKLKSSINLAA